MNGDAASAVCVLGAAGFIGRHVVAELVRRGRPVVALTDTAAPPSSAGVRWIEQDLDLEPPATHGANVCVHLAEPSVLSDETAAQRNLVRAQRILAQPFERIVYISSAVVYGDQHATPRAETDELAANTTYARAKAAVERIVLADPRCAVARLANVYGRGMSPHNVLSDILAQVGSAEPLTLRDLAPVRDYLHVTDAARALVMLAAAPATGVFNVGTGRGTSVRELAALACAAAGAPDRAIVGIAQRPASSTLVLDVERMRRELGWSAAVTVEQGVADLVRDQLP